MIYDDARGPQREVSTLMIPAQKRMRKDTLRWKRSRLKFKLIDTRNIDGIQMAAQYAVIVMNLVISFVHVASLEVD